MSRSFFRTVIAAVLLSLSFSSFAHASMNPARERILRVELLRMAIEFLVKHGCGIDPHGVCTPSPLKRGCTIDPHGACLPSSATPAPETDRGCGIDPNGACIGR